jgi:uncharacterized membrane protein
METLNTALEIIVPPLAGLAVLVLVWGVCCALVQLTVMEYRMLRGLDYINRRDVIRQHLGYYLLLGLEFLVAVDVLETIRDPSPEQLMSLGGVVLVRTVISFTLHWELQQSEKASA